MKRISDGIVHLLAAAKELNYVGEPYSEFLGTSYFEITIERKQANKQEYEAVDK